MDAGHLMSISLYQQEEDYDFLPSYEEIGILKNNQISYHVLVEYPTDVQFDEKNAKTYQQLMVDSEKIMKTIKANQGYEYIAFENELK